MATKAAKGKHSFSTFTKVTLSQKPPNINLQSLEDTQVEYILQKYT